MTALETVGRNLPGTSTDTGAVLTAAWLNSLESDNTRRAYSTDWDTWAEWITGHGIDPWEAHFPHVEAWDREAADAGAKRSTRARRLASLSSAYRYAVKAGRRPDNPVERVTRPKAGEAYTHHTPALSEAEQDALVAAAVTPQDRALVLLLLTTAIRVSEAMSLDLDDLTGEKGQAVIRLVGKGGKVNTVPVVPRLGEALDAILTDRQMGPIFLAEHGGRMTRQGATRALARLGRAAIGRPVAPHSLRATAITTALDNNVPIVRVQRMARHSDIRTTMTYYRASEDLTNHPAHLLAALMEKRAR